MTTSTVPDAFTPAPAALRAGARRTAVPWVLPATLFASTCIVVGLIWDISWHRTIGRDTFWSPPHVVEQLAAIVAGLGCGWLVLRTTFAGSAADRAATVRFWGFRGPLGAWVCIWGTLTMITSAPFDNWWHDAYGLDVTVISPPHVVLAFGMIALQVGAMLVAVAAQNRGDGEGGVSDRRLSLLYAYAAGVLVAMTATVMIEHASFANHMHGSSFYKVTGAVFPFALVAFAWPSRLRWPATTIAAIYAGITLVMIWTLQLFPATPKLAPIYNMVTHMVPPPFPMLLVFPGVAIDLLLRRIQGAGWGAPRAALALGVAFVAVMLAVHWPFAEFMLSPAARNPVFAADQWDYTIRLGAWQYEYWNLDRDAAGHATAPLFARGMVTAVVLAVVSSGLGVACGKALARVRR